MRNPLEFMRNGNGFVSGLVWGEICSLYSDGLTEYISDLWNIVDFCTNSFYIGWIFLRATSFFISWVSKMLF